MRYIDSWLTGLGLEYIIPKLKANGITTPKKLAQLTLRDMYEVVGVEDSEDRKKLYFLIQRLHTILNNKAEAPGSPGSDDSEPAVPPPRSPEKPKSIRMSGSSFGDEPSRTVGSSHTEEDLRVLRRNRRTSAEGAAPPVLLSPAKQNGGGSSTVSDSQHRSVPYVIRSARNTDAVSGVDGLSLGEREGGPKEVAAAARPRKVVSAPERPASPEEDDDVPVLSARNMRAEPQSSRPNRAPVASNRQRARSPSPDASPPPPPSSSFARGGADQPPAGRGSRPAVAARAAPAPPPRREAEAEWADQDDDEEEDGGGGIEDMAIRVVVRKRPLSRGELGKGDRDVMDVERGGSVLVHEPKTKVDLTKVIETQRFTFDDAFDAADTNEAIYARTIRHLVSFVFGGGKASCFAYGQTGSGKTFSMMGSRPDAPQEATVNAGLYVLAARDIFAQVRKPRLAAQQIKVLVSCFEIYGGKLFDLLNGRGPVKCLEDSKQQVQLPGLTEHLVRGVSELLELMATAHTQRSTGSTGANAESSRSHMVMQIVLRDGSAAAKPAVVGRGVTAAQAAAINAAAAAHRFPGGKLSFIDLAGSERGADTTHNSKQTRMEGAEINTSLLALKEVIRSLERKHGHTPFRGSKLTQVLKDSFVGDRTRTCMVACVSPAHSNCEHTLNTLRYADRVKEHQSGGTAGGSAGAHVSSSQYDSMAYDYVPPSKAAERDRDPQRPQTAGSAAPSRPAPPVSSVQQKATKALAPLQKAPPAVDRKPPAAAPEYPRGNSASRIPSSSSAAAPAASDPRSRKAPPAAADLDSESGASDGNRRAPAAAKAPAARRQSAASQEESVRARAGPKVAVQRQQQPASEDDGSNYEGDQQRRQALIDRSRAVQPAPHHAHRAPPRSAKVEDDEGSDADGSYPVAYSGRESRASVAAGYAPARDLDAPDGGDEDEEEGSFGAGRASSEEEDDANEDEDDEHSYSGAGAGSDAEGAELIRQTVGLLSAHKLSIAEMVEVMKEEMELVQDMEDVDDRDSELYLERLQAILAAKADAVAGLRTELRRFQQYRARSSAKPAAPAAKSAPPAAAAGRGQRY